MATTTTRRRITPGMSPAERKRAVKDLLRELAYVLNVTRTVSRELCWPTATEPGYSHSSTPGGNSPASW
jgi:hypothetical protein